MELKMKAWRTTNMRKWFTGGRVEVDWREEKIYG